MKKRDPDRSSATPVSSGFWLHVGLFKIMNILWTSTYYGGLNLDGIHLNSMADLKSWNFKHERLISEQLS
jgi:hypothetical protein